MRKCKICGSVINDDEIYYDIVIWEMSDGVGVESDEKTVCQTCKEKVLGH